MTPNVGIQIKAGYRAGLIGAATLMHARYYAREVGFGSYFEAKVASGLAEFTQRLAGARNQIWCAMQQDEIVGSIAIDGEHFSTALRPIAHLRWFIVGDSLRGRGVGQSLLAAALRFCDLTEFEATELWTFQGLTAARKLYEAHGFSLVQELPGTQWGATVIEQRFVRPRRCIEMTCD